MEGRPIRRLIFWLAAIALPFFALGTLALFGFLASEWYSAPKAVDNDCPIADSTYGAPSHWQWWPPGTACDNSPGYYEPGTGTAVLVVGLPVITAALIVTVYATREPRRRVPVTADRLPTGMRVG